MHTQVLNGINSLENPKAQQLGVMILATSQRLDQLWSKCSPAAVLGWMAKTPVRVAWDVYAAPMLVGSHPLCCFHSWKLSLGSIGIEVACWRDVGLMTMKSTSIMEVCGTSAQKANGWPWQWRMPGLLPCVLFETNQLFMLMPFHLRTVCHSRPIMQPSLLAIQCAGLPVRRLCLLLRVRACLSDGFASQCAG
eukprot:1138804-Pelagomonas_calceolata.AAC.5